MNQENTNALDRKIKNAINSIDFAIEQAKDGMLLYGLREARQSLTLVLGMVKDGRK